MENDIPFPLLAGQFVAAYENNVKSYYKISGQPVMVDLAYPYEIGPDLEIADQTITLGKGSGAISAFRTNNLKQWVTWIDNDYLTVQWTIDNVNINSLNSFIEPLTAYISPFGTINFPLFILHNVSGNVTFTLSNTSLTKTIAGTLHIIMYDYKIEPVSSAPPQYTDIDYRGRSQ